MSEGSSYMQECSVTCERATDWHSYSDANLALPHVNVPIPYSQVLVMEHKETLVLQR